MRAAFVLFPLCVSVVCFPFARFILSANTLFTRRDAPAQLHLQKFKSFAKAVKYIQHTHTHTHHTLCRQYAYLQSADSTVPPTASLGALGVGLARPAPAERVRCVPGEPGAVDGGVGVVRALAHLALHAGGVVPLRGGLGLGRRLLPVWRLLLLLAHRLRMG